MIELRASVLVGMPTLGTISHHVFGAAIGQSCPAMMKISWQMIPGHTTAEARNRLTHMAREGKFRYILFWDDDVVPPRFCLHHLFTLMEMHPEWTVLSGVYATKSHPPTPLVYKEWGEGSCWDWKMGEIFQVKLGALGLSIIRVADLEKLDDIPEYEALLNGENVRVREYFSAGRSVGEDGRNNFWTEDVTFAMALEKAGLKWFVDASQHTIAKHVDITTNTVFSVPLLDGSAVLPDPMNADRKVCNLGAGNVYFQGSTEVDPKPHVITVDLNEEAHPTFRCDVRVLPTEWHEMFDEVMASHVLEHIRWEETDETLEEWVRILKPGGELKVGVPDLKAAAEMVLRDELSPFLMGAIYGDQRSDYWNAGQDVGIHMAGFTPKDIGERLVRQGLVDVKVESFSNAMMRATGRKPLVKAKKQQPSVAVSGDGVKPEAVKA
jgi:hypothetical protein